MVHRGCGQPEASQSVHSEATLLDGGSACTYRFTEEERRLDDLYRPEGCLSVSADISGAQEVSLVSVGQSTVSVSMPTIRVEQCLKDFHKYSETSHGTLEVEWDTFNSVYRRYPSDGTVPRGASPSGTGTDSTFAAAGLYDQLGEINSEPMPGNNISRLFGEFIANGPQSTRGEVAEYYSRLQESFETGDSIGERAGGHTGSDTGSTLLQESIASQEFNLQ